MSAQVTASIGLTLYPEHGTDSRALVHNADQALYRVKGRGGNCVALYGEK